MATRSAPKATPAMCWLSIGYVEILLPADAGLKVVQLLRGAMRCETGYDNGRFFELRDELDVEYAAVKAGQVRAKTPDETRASPPNLQLVYEPLKLPRP